MKKIPLIILTGPTAVGKTNFIDRACQRSKCRNNICRFNANI